MRKYLAILSLIFCSANLQAQELNDKLKLSGYAQFWLRNSEMNPGTLYKGEPIENVWDFSIRRLRLSAEFKPTDRLRFFMTLGNNNYNKLTAKESLIKLMDAFGEYSINDYLIIGVGKSAFTGYSRLSAFSGTTLVTFDGPVFSIATLNRSDFFGRSPGVWLKAQPGKFDLRLVVNQPYAVELFREDGISFNDTNLSWKYSGYLKYQFFETESNSSPFSAGTYLADKKVLALGSGFVYQSDAMADRVAGDISNTYDLLNYAVDLFWNLPNGKNAWSGYAAYYRTDYGPGYIRNLGPNNIATGVDPSQASFNGLGTAFPQFGSGNSYYAQLGYVWRIGDLEKQRYLQPGAAIYSADFDRAFDQINSYQLSISYLLNGQNSKFTLGYENRPIMNDSNQGLVQIDRSYLWVLQYQIKF